MSSGIHIAEECTKTFAQLRKREFSAIVLKVNDDMTEVKVEKTVVFSTTDLENEWKSFVKSLPENDCRFAMADFQWRDSPTVTTSKICMILWSPDTAPVRSKMYATLSFYVSSVKNWICFSLFSDTLRAIIPCSFLCSSLTTGRLFFPWHPHVFSLTKLYCFKTGFTRLLRRPFWITLQVRMMKFRRKFRPPSMTILLTKEWKIPSRSDCVLCFLQRYHRSSQFKDIFLILSACFVTPLIATGHT